MRGLCGGARGLVVALVSIGLLGVGVVPAGAGSGASGAPPSLLQQLIGGAEALENGGATMAVVRAADRGYDLEQILEGLVQGSLAADGTIADDGDPVEPARPPAGVITGNATGTVHGKARAGEPTSPEDIALDALERGVQKTTRRLSARDDLAEHAEEYDTTADVFTMLAVLLLMEEGYSIEQIVVDGLMANGIDILPFSGVIQLVDDEGRPIPPEGVDSVTGGDTEDLAAVSSFMEGVFDAVSGEDPMAAADDSFRRQYTLTIDVTIEDGEGGRGTIEGKANIGTRKGGEKDGLLSGRGTGKYTANGACSMSDLDTREYPWSASAPVQFGIAGVVDGPAELSIGMRPSAPVDLDAAGDSICLSVLRDTADAALAMYRIPNVKLRLANGETARASSTTGSVKVDVSVSVRAI